MISPGQTISHYKIISLVGLGGMGEVFLAEHINLGRKVAIKVLNPDIAKNQDIRMRFTNEARILANLDHLNIIKIHDFFSADDNLIIIMEYSAGEPISSILSRTGPIQEDRSINIFNKILNAFSYAHGKGIVHRDIKPSNIMLEQGDKPKILDFGIAKITHSDFKLTKDGTKIGSIYYMSPEQVLSREITYSSDVYSLGVTLYEMLTGNLPYDTNTDSDYEIQHQIVSKPVLPIRDVNPQVSVKIQSALFRAMQKNPSDRFRNCNEFLSSLKSEQPTEIVYNRAEKTVIEPRQLSPSAPLKKSRSNNKLIFVLIGFFAVVIAVLIYLIIQKTGSDDLKTETVKKDKTENTETTSKNPTPQTSEDATGKIKQLFNEWKSDLMGKNIGIMRMYSDPVNFYYQGYKSKSYVTQEKRGFFNKWDEISMRIDNETITMLEANRYKVTFDNAFVVSNYSSGKVLDAKTRNHLTFEKISGEWLIVEEIEEKQYYVNKNY